MNSWTYKPDNRRDGEPRGRRDRGRLRGVSTRSSIDRARSLSKIAGRYQAVSILSRRQWIIPNLGPCSLPLTPDAENEMYGGAAFTFHGDSTSMDETASKGCVVLIARGARSDRRVGYPNADGCRLMSLRERLGLWLLGAPGQSTAPETKNDAAVTSTLGGLGWPQPMLYAALGGYASNTGVPVTPFTALQAAAVYACIRAISQDMAMLQPFIRRTLSAAAIGASFSIR